MTRPWKLLGLASTLAVPLLLAGCVGEVMQQAQTAARRKEIADELKKMGLARFEFHDTHRRFPETWAELQSVGVPASLQQALEAEGFSVLMGLSVKDFKSGTSNSVVVFRRDTAQKGGVVLLCDGSVRLVSAEEFNKMWNDQPPYMTNAIILDPPAGGASAPAAGGGSAPPPPPGGGSAPPPPPGN
jgi:hypothetical protein